MADNIESTYELDVTGFLAAMDKVDGKLSSTEANLIKLSKVDPFKEAAKSASELEKEVSGGVKTFGQVTATVEAYKEELKKLDSQYQNLITRKKEFVAAGKYDEYTKQIESVRERIGSLNKVLETSTKSAGGLRGMIGNVTGKLKEMVTSSSAAEGIFGRFLPAATSLFGALGIAVAATTVFIYRAKQGYLEMNDAMLVASGSQKNVTNNMEVLDSIATDLELTLRVVTAAYGQLANNGLAPTSAQMKNLGVLSKELKTDLGSLSKAITEADKGNVSALQSLGVQAVVNGNKIKLSFRGVTEEFKKGSGDSVKALSEISTQIEKTENSAEKIGRFDFMDRFAKGMVDAEKALDDAADTTNKKAYPAFERLNKLLIVSRNAILDWAESFGIWTQTTWEHTKNEAMLLIAAFGYISDLKNQGFAKANENFNTSFEAFKKNKDLIKAESIKAQGLVGKDQGGELKTDNKKLIGDDAAAIAAQKRRAEKEKAELLKVEKEYQDALKKLEDQYGKDKLTALKEDHIAYLKLKKQLDLEEVDQEEKKVLLLKQLAAGAQKGNYDKDGKAIADKSVQLSDDEKKPYDFRRQLISDLEYYERAKFITENEKEITKAISDEFQVRLQNIEDYYKELFKKSEIDGFRRKDLEKKKQKDLAKVETDQRISAIDKKLFIDTANAEIAVIKAKIADRIDLELDAREKLLNIEKEGIKEKIKVLSGSTDPESKALVAGYEKAIAQIDGDLAELGKTRRGMSPIEKLLTNLGFTGEGIEAIETAGASILNSVTELYSTLNQLSQNRINRIDQEISKKEEQVEKERELNEEGVANNLSLRQKELADLKAQREKALKDQQRTQKQALILDTIVQSSSMITAASKVFASLAGLPFGAGVPLGIAAVALMLGSFAAAKIKAFQLAKEQSTQQYRYGGMINGPSHERGGVNITHEVEGGEYVINRKSTAKYLDIIEAINKDKAPFVLDYLLRDMVNETGISMPDSVRSEHIQFVRQHEARKNSHNNELIGEIRELKEELEEIKKNTSRIPKFQAVNVGEGQYAEISPNSTVVKSLPKY